MDHDEEISFEAFHGLELSNVPFLVGFGKSCGENSRQFCYVPLLTTHRQSRKVQGIFPRITIIYSPDRKLYITVFRTTDHFLPLRTYVASENYQ